MSRTWEVAIDARMFFRVTAETEKRAEALVIELVNRIGGVVAETEDVDLVDVSPAQKIASIEEEIEYPLDKL